MAKEKVGLIILARKLDYIKGRRWEAVHNTIKSFTEKDGDYKFEIVVCGNGQQDWQEDDCPIEEVQKNGTYIELGSWDLQKIIRLGLDHCIEKKCEHTVVIRGGFVVDDLKWMDNKKFTVQSFVSPLYDHKYKMLGTDFMYGKTRTVDRVWTNRPFDRTDSKESNLYKNVINVVGIDYLKDSYKLDFLTSHELGLKAKLEGFRNL